MVIYARYEHSKGYQELSKHLEGTTIKIEKLLQTQLIKHVIDHLAQLTRVDPIEVIEAAKTAAVFHDIGKALYYYQKQVYEVTKEVKERSEKCMNFTLHEIISANIFAQTLHIHVNRTLRYPYSNPWLSSLTIQAILLHHQGLRTITIGKLYSNIVNNIIADNPSISIQNVQSVIKDIRSLINCNIAKILIEILEQNINNIVSLYNPLLIQHLYNLDDHAQIQMSRIITGCLMIADTWDAYVAMHGKASRYVQDIVIRYLKTLGIMMYDR